jgi:hypothetical protein
VCANAISTRSFPLPIARRFITGATSRATSAPHGDAAPHWTGCSAGSALPSVASSSLLSPLSCSFAAVRLTAGRRASVFSSRLDRCCTVRRLEGYGWHTTRAAEADTVATAAAAAAADADAVLCHRVLSELESPLPVGEYLAERTSLDLTDHLTSIHPSSAS